MDHHSSKKIGCFELKCGLLKDRNYFDPAKPVMPGASKTLHEYEKSMFSEDDDYIKEDLYYPSINRNSQYIGNLYPYQHLNHLVVEVMVNHVFNIL